MKAIQYLGILLLFFGIIAFTKADFFNREGIVGNGKVVEQERNVGPFDQIRINGVFNVYLSQGNEEKVTVVADENLQDVILTENEGHQLRLSLKKGVEIKKSKKTEIYVTLKNIDQMEIASVGKTETKTPLQLKSLDLKVSSVGATDLALDCQQLNVKADMVGNLSLRGKAGAVDIRNSGVGSLKAFDLKARTLSIDNKGVGSAELNASDEISIFSSGVGNIKYKGNAVVKDLQVNGVGKVKKI